MGARCSVRSRPAKRISPTLTTIGWVVQILRKSIPKSLDTISKCPSDADASASSPIAKALPTDRILTWPIIRPRSIGGAPPLNMSNDSANLISAPSGASMTSGVSLFIPSTTLNGHNFHWSSPICSQFSNSSAPSRVCNRLQLPNCHALAG